MTAKYKPIVNNIVHNSVTSTARQFWDNITTLGKTFDPNQTRGNHRIRILYSASFRSVCQSQMTPVMQINSTKTNAIMSMVLLNTRLPRRLSTSAYSRVAQVQTLVWIILLRHENNDPSCSFYPEAFDVIACMWIGGSKVCLYTYMSEWSRNSRVVFFH